MRVSLDSLQQRYASLTDEALIELDLNGELLPEAKELLHTELEHRGLATGNAARNALEERARSSARPRWIDACIAGAARKLIWAGAVALILVFFR